MPGAARLYARRFDEAIAKLKETIQLNPNYPVSHGRLSGAHAAKGMCKESVEEAIQARTLYGERDRAQALQHGLSAGGCRGALQSEIQDLEEKAKREYVTPVDLAFDYTQLGDKDRAIAWLEKGFDAHASDMLSLKVEPLYDPLRSDPRFQDLLRRMNFPPN
jgi:adenylate cyclase